MVCLVAVMLTGPASAWVNRVNAAVHLFETVCVPIVYGKSWRPIARANGAKRSKPNRKKTVATRWNDAASGFRVKISELANGYTHCDLRDGSDILPMRARKELEKRLASRMPELLPMLENLKDTPKKHVAYVNSWIDTRYPEGHPKWWGVMHTRLRSKKNGFTWIVLFYPSDVPTS